VTYITVVLFYWWTITLNIDGHQHKTALGTPQNGYWYTSTANYSINSISLSGFTLKTAQHSSMLLSRNVPQ